MKLYIIITLLVILLIILFYNVYNESFTDPPKPVAQNSDVRVDFTCASSDQKNIFDRFDYAQQAKSNICPSNYTRINNYFGSSNLCLPNCPPGYTISPNDNTLCIANVCYNTPDLSENILGSWNKTCSVIYKNQYNLDTTLTNISNVTDSFRKQTGIVNSRYNDLNDRLQSIDCSLPGNSNKCIIRDRHIGDIGANYNTIMNITSNINYNYNYLSNRKNTYDSVYYDLLCDRYI